MIISSNLEFKYRFRFFGLYFSCSPEIPDLIQNVGGRGSYLGLARWIEDLR